MKVNKSELKETPRAALWDLPS